MCYEHLRFILCSYDLFFHSASKAIQLNPSHSALCAVRRFFFLPFFFESRSVMPCALRSGIFFLPFFFKSRFVMPCALRSGIFFFGLWVVKNRMLSAAKIEFVFSPSKNRFFFDWLKNRDRIENLTRQNKVAARQNRIVFSPNKNHVFFDWLKNRERIENFARQNMVWCSPKTKVAMRQTAGQRKCPRVNAGVLGLTQVS